MSLRMLRRTKTVLLTFGLLSVTMYMLLSLLSEEFSMDDRETHEVRAADTTRTSKYHAGFLAQPQRKPKTMDLAESEDWTSNAYQNYKNENKFERKYIHEQMRMKVSPNKDVNRFHQPDKQQKALPSLSGSKVTKENNEYNEESEVEEEEDADDNDDYEYDDTNATNAPFKPGDFGNIRGLEFYQKPKLQYAEVTEDEEKRKSNEEIKKSMSAMVENGIFWTGYVESFIPKGLSYSNVTNLLQKWRKQVIKILDKPSWDRCGRPQNGYAVLQDGTRMCVRYRQPQSSFVYGEALSFYLSLLLQMDNVPAVVLAQTSSTSKQWRAVNISSLTWKENKTVAFIQWIDNINSGTSSKAYIPPIILQAYRKGVPITGHVINKSLLFQRNPSLLADVVQWGTMIVFDYLTGNYDRIASMQDAEDREKDPKIIEEPIRNLRKSSRDNKLWLIDNESGLLDAYELLEPFQPKSRFSKFHRQMLQTTCVFQPSLVNSVLKLYEHPSPHQRLLRFANSFEPLISNLSKEDHFKLFVDMFDQRVSDVVNWIRYCQALEAG